MRKNKKKIANNEERFVKNINLLVNISEIIVKSSFLI